ncbi:MAG TPA: N-acetylmuramoyl-L-alanine amidase [Pseudolabrys sp.]|nr:N-acetylmuramoyl-L-alanine amidase [Pseudolabrys sp.]
MTVRGNLLAAAVIAVLAGSPGYGGALAANGSDSTAARSDHFPIATDVRVGGDGKQTRFVMDFSDRVELATFTLADPYRVVVDLPQVVFKLPPKSGEHGRGLIKEFRYGLIMRGGSRIVLDTDGPVRIGKAFMLAASEGQPARLVIDLVPTDRQSFLHDMALATRPPRIDAKESVSIAKDSSGDQRPLIVIDPGHGGIDSGTKSSGGQDEKDVVLGFSLLLRDKLLKTGKYRIAMTRSDDTFVPLNDRVRFARSRKASLFISIHADSIPRSEGQAEGATVYTLSEHASDAEAARLADAENKSDAIAGVDLTSQPDDVATILIDLAQRETKTFSAQFAHMLVSEFKNTTRLHQHPLKSAGFIVLKAPDVPSVLVELGYMSTKDDLQHLMSPAWRARTADSLVSAVDSFFAPRLAGGAVLRGSN